ncbi:hypothetical protein GCM10022254_03490 [Actinomadura meridiana]|uniref:Uncharacterized protein n=1 Tax=Actinomadura meridiana TaxID=559626 RepID=A0ABP8BS22_9ACTN
MGAIWRFTCSNSDMARRRSHWVRITSGPPDSPMQDALVKDHAQGGWVVAAQDRLSAHACGDRLFTG